MKYLLLITLLTVFSANTAISQIQSIEYSQSFEEPINSWNKLLQLENGQTFYFSFDVNNGITVTDYNTNREIVSKKYLPSSIWNPEKISATIVSGIYEIDNQPVLFLTQNVKKTAILYRIQLDKENGAILSHKKIGEHPKEKFAKSYAITYGDVDEVGFKIYKDPNSNNYIVVNFNSSAESDKRVEVIQYIVENGLHKEANRSYCSSEKYKYSSPITALVDGDDCYVLTYGYNPKATGEEDSRIIISKRNINSKSFTQSQIEFTDDFLSTNGIMKKNAELGLIQLLTQTYLRGESGANYYLDLMSYIDPESLQVTKKLVVPSDDLNSYMKRNYTNTDDYTGLVEDMIINKDNTTTLVSEEEALETYTSKYSALTHTYLKRIGVVTLDYKGTVTNAECILKKHSFFGSATNFNHNKRRKGIKAIPQKNKDHRSSHFFSYDYINTSKNNSYIIYNELPKNRNEKDYENIEEFDVVSTSATVYNKLGQSKLNAQYLYEVPNDDKTSFSAVESSSFKNDTYAVVMIARSGRNKDAHIAWITFE